MVNFSVYCNCRLLYTIYTLDMVTQCEIVCGAEQLTIVCSFMLKVNKRTTITKNAPYIKRNRWKLWPESWYLPSTISSKISAKFACSNHQTISRVCLPKSPSSNSSLSHETNSCVITASQKKDALVSDESKLIIRF